MPFLDITSPTLLLNTQVCRANIKRMADKCKRLGVGLNPHFKTHQSKEVGNWFKQEGVERITVSSIVMAEYFADAGWDDITIAFPVNVREMDRINSLAERVKLSLFVVTVESAISLSTLLKHKVEVIIEVDAGYGRTGIPVDITDRIDKILGAIDAAPQLSFYGFYLHAGHTYDVRGKQSVADIHQQSLSGLQVLRKRYKTTYPHLKISLGDTPSCSMLDNFDGVAEIRPGNFVFFDVTQATIGSCSFSDIAVVQAASVVSIEPSRYEILVHAGAIHLSKESMLMETNDGERDVYGLICQLSHGSWGEPLEGCYVRKVSQEHGIIRMDKSLFGTFVVGDVVGILPVHSCLTADCMGGYLTEKDEYIRMMNWRR